MCIKFSLGSVPCNNTGYHLLNTYFYRAEAFPCINHNNSFTENSLMCPELFEAGTHSFPALILFTSTLHRLFMIAFSHFILTT